MRSALGTGETALLDLTFARLRVARQIRTRAIGLVVGRSDPPAVPRLRRLRRSCSPLAANHERGTPAGSKVTDGATAVEPFANVQA